jgi:hypothetical protein
MKRSNLSTTTGFKDLLQVSGRLLLLLLLLVLFNEGVFYVLVHVYPSRGDYHLEVVKKGSRFKRLFLGSSRTHMGINTPLFDSLEGVPNTSFNLGASGFTLADQYIAMENVFALGGKPEEMIFELIPALFNNTNAPVLLQGGTKSAWQLSSRLPLSDGWSFLKSIISQRFALPFRVNLKDSLILANTRLQGYDTVTFGPVAPWEHLSRTKPYALTGLTQRHKRLVLATETVVKQIVKRCREQGVRALFLLPVQATETELYVLGTVWEALSPELKWEYRQHPYWNELQSPANWQNFLHSSTQGARIYTRILADTYPIANR